MRHSLNSTYRLQLNGTFGFEAARATVEYLAELGITDVYSSPLLAARRGSTHGYDVVDHGRLNEELGTPAQFEAWSDALRSKGLGLLLDWVPNHMGIAGGENRWWDDVLENGPSSLFADYFDIDWRAPKEALHDRVLLPILGDSYGDVLERGELRVVWDNGVSLAYHERRLPLGPKSLISLFESVASRCALPEQDVERQELESILSALRHLPDRHETEPAMRAERARENEVTKRRLVALFHQSAPLRKAIEDAMVELNGTPGTPSTFEGLDRLLREQSYRLASWRVAAEEINYRRFFDVNDLAALRMETDEVYRAAHAFLFELIDAGRVQALRLDHTDGLYDPYGYFETMQRRFVPSSAGVAGSHQIPDDHTRPLAILVEKILEPAEDLPARWPVDGTTGYEFAVALNGVRIDLTAEASLTSFYQEFTGDRRSFREHAYESKKHILSFSLASEVHMLARALERIASANRQWQDFTLSSLTHALAETIAAFSIYRTYLREGEVASSQDVQRIERAIRTARRRSVSVSPAVFAFLEELLLLRTRAPDDERQMHVRFALRFQQLTGPVMAKSVEDTAFYRYHRFIALNEVGGSPSKFGTSIDEFHRGNAERARSWPRSMVTSSTHDTKRGEDAAARMAVISELPTEWRETVARWSSIAEPFRPVLEGERVPERGLEYLFYQTLVGAWPFGWDGIYGREVFSQRLSSFMVKATKEGKERSSWTNPDIAYDQAVESFVAAALGSDTFVNEVRSFSERISTYGAANAIAGAVLKLCSPGVADTYQGSELWNQSLVDPDNRQSVDFAARRRMLRALMEAPLDGVAVRELRNCYADGRIKMFVTATLLRARKNHPDLFLRGDYEPLSGNEHVVGFRRSLGDQHLVVLTTRLSFRRTQGRAPWAIGDVWGEETQVVPVHGTYRNLFTNETVRIGPTVALGRAFAELPVAVFVNEIDG
jgi:(1->4)-alpha-D-glucan 1-alpha-D-glucosylmutase